MRLFFLRLTTQVSHPSPHEFTDYIPSPPRSTPARRRRFFFVDDDDQIVEDPRPPQVQPGPPHTQTFAPHVDTHDTGSEPDHYSNNASVDCSINNIGKYQAAQSRAADALRSARHQRLNTGESSRNVQGARPPTPSAVASIGDCSETYHEFASNADTDDDDVQIRYDVEVRARKASFHRELSSSTFGSSGVHAGCSYEACSTGANTVSTRADDDYEDDGMSATASASGVYLDRYSRSEEVECEEEVGDRISAGGANDKLLLSGRGGVVATKRDKIPCQGGRDADAAHAAHNWRHRQQQGGRDADAAHAAHNWRHRQQQGRERRRRPSTSDASTVSTSGSSVKAASAFMTRVLNEISALPDIEDPHIQEQIIRAIRECGTRH
jgi:hypothetical protein